MSTDKRGGKESLTWNWATGGNLTHCVDDIVIYWHSNRRRMKTALVLSTYFPHYCILSFCDCSGGKPVMWPLGKLSLIGFVYQPVTVIRLKVVTTGGLHEGNSLY